MGARRTTNLLRGMIRGLWILEYEFVVDSLTEGKWLNEELYELRDFSKAIEVSFFITERAQDSSSINVFS